MCYNPYSLEGKTILVTGASSGIGRATAIECSKMGANVVITGRNQERLNETFNELEDGEHFQFAADMLNVDDLNSLVEFTPKLDGCVNNAGITKMVLTQFIKHDDLTSVININTIAPIVLTQKLVKSRKMKNPSSFVFTSSIGGVYISTIGNSVYAASKGAIHGFLQSAARDLAPKGIRVNSVNPGMVHTKILDNGPLSDQEIKKNMEKYPLKRYGNPEEIAHAIIYLLSDAASWVTGTALKIDGGISL